MVDREGNLILTDVIYSPKAYQLINDKQFSIYEEFVKDFNP
jgi:hypothetical protein